MYDVIVIGGATRDFFMGSRDFRVENGFLLLPWGEKVVADSLIREVGGGGSNAAVALSRFGLRTALVSRVGEDASGEVIAQRLRKEGVSLDLLQIEPRGTTSTSVVLTAPSGEHTIVMYRGHNDEVIGEDFAWEALAQTSWLYLADVAARQKDPSLSVAAFASSHQLKLVFVPGQHQIKRGFKGIASVVRQAEVFILNAYEAQTILGEKVKVAVEGDPMLSSLDKMLEKFHRLGAKNVIITADIHGVRAFDGKEFFFQEAPQVTKVVNTTGAGDAFAAGLVAGLVRGLSFREALALGSENAGAVLWEMGAQSGLIRRKI